ncbi:PCDH1 [Bugula neritina]|uniref:PCDH1 n=1 Tax=Bugula neritina TaxID=10212 RepID=A0A7J7ITN8_BUGNE|nr:PCDH1 [Bugula neritina]
MGVNIIDVNDQKPAFDRLVYSTPLIAENNEVGVHVVQVLASDKDLNTNAEIQYRLGGEEDTGYFSIDKLSGLITAKSRLDRERQGTYTFSVLAVDRGDPPLTATAAVFVQIADLNDNAPSFNVTHYEMSVAENMPKYSFVGKVTAMDPDERANGNVWYRIANASSGPFIIAHDTGIISTRSPLDREKIGGGQYQVTVVATDYGTPTLSSDIKVNIHVLDENDNKPIITSAENMTLTCSYQTPVNTTIGKVVAFDPDTAENGRIGYFIQHGNSYGMFKIDKRSGEIKVQSKINSAMAGYYRLGIGVHDNGLPPHTVMSSVGIDVTKEAYVPPEHLVGYDHVSRKTPNHRTYNVNLVVVIVLSSISGVLSVILIVAIIRIKRQTKENHSYNCRTEAQKLFNQSARGGSQPYRPSCESSWAALSTTDRSSVYSRTSGASDNEADEPIAVQTFMTTFSKTTSDVALALQSYEKSNLQKQSRILNKSVNSSRGSAMLHRAVLNKTLKEPDGDSGTCEDTCSVHNSTPVLAASQNDNPPSTQGPSLQSFQSKFLATSTNMEEVQETKVPSSINSVDNSLNTNSSHNGSPALLDQNSSANHKHEDGSVVSAHITSHQPNHGGVCMPPQTSPGE